MEYDPITRWAALVAAVLLCFIFALGLWSAARGPTTQERLDTIEEKIEFQTCLLLLPIEERMARGVADCAAQEDD